jgi:glutamine synthetase
VEAGGPSPAGVHVLAVPRPALVLRTLGEHTFNRFVEIKRQEWEDYRVQVTPWELERYLGIL